MIFQTATLRRFFSVSDILPYVLLFICSFSAILILVMIKTTQNSISLWVATQEISVFAASDMTEDEKISVTRQISSMNPAAQMTHLNPDQTKEMMISELGLSTEISQASFGELIPNLFIIKGVFSEQDLNLLAQKIKGLPGVEEIQWGSSWAQKLKPFVRVFEQAAWVLFAGVFLFFHLLISYLVLEMMKKEQKKFHIMSFLGATTFQIEKEVFKCLSIFLVVCLTSSFLLIGAIFDVLQDAFSATLVVMSGFRIQMLSWDEVLLFVLFAFVFAFLSAKKSLTV